MKWQAQKLLRRLLFLKTNINSVHPSAAADENSSSARHAPPHHRTIEDVEMIAMEKSASPEKHFQILADIWDKNKLI